MIGQNQVREDTRLVEEAAEADDERDLGEGVANLPGSRSGKDRVHPIEQQGTRLGTCSDSRNDASCWSVACRPRAPDSFAAAATSICGVKNIPPGVPTLPTSAFNAFTATAR